MSDRIDPVAKAHEILRAVQDLMDKPSDGYQAAQHVQNLAFSTIAAAQVHATLALVEQQRIANIIAIANNVSEDPDVTVTDGERAAWLALCDEESPHSLRPEIREALGIRE